MHDWLNSTSTSSASSFVAPILAATTLAVALNAVIPWLPGPHEPVSLDVIVTLRLWRQLLQPLASSDEA